MFFLRHQFVEKSREFYHRTESSRCARARTKKRSEITFGNMGELMTNLHIDFFAVEKIGDIFQEFFKLSKRIFVFLCRLLGDWGAVDGIFF
jgi:hypothetical protein